ncbi:MAG TPA: helix-turn-helix transcriptional regulator [bacterium]|nr:helix-turn-helix transcriptional regulator [bacterium]HOL46818.1 helix-turn-helix transcriptional regulator [bacterium]HPQ18656.1 helix-turn-helix transcriptional regulator [bacterium]
MRIGDKIKALRLTQGNITKEKLALALEISEDKLTAYEKNLTRPPHHIIVKLAEFFNVPSEFFFEDDKEEYNENTKEEIFKKPEEFQEINIAKMTISTKNKKIIKEEEKEEKILPKSIPSNKETNLSQKETIDKESSNMIETYFKIFHNDLINIKTLLNKLIEIESNKPQLTNITEIERTKDINIANKLLKSGYVLLELFKDDKGQLGFTLGKK